MLMFLLVLELLNGFVSSLVGSIFGAFGVGAA